ncbi:MAG: hypothetical protein ABJN57_14575 [Hyphomicrobiales bacterium]
MQRLISLSRLFDELKLIGLRGRGATRRAELALRHVTQPEKA